MNLRYFYMGESSFSENSTSDEKCLALFKIATEEGLDIPPPNVHMYLAQILEIPNNFKLQKTMSKYVVNSVEELNHIVEENRFSLYPNALPFLVSKMSGDFLTSYNSLISGGEKDVGFPAVCYSTAGFYGGKMGKREESQIFGLLAMDLDKYTNLLEKYHLRVRRDSNFNVDDNDFLEFKKRFMPKRKNTRIVIPRKKDKFGDELLI